MKNLPFSLVLFLTVLLISCTNTTQEIQNDWTKASLVWSDEFEGTTIDTTKWLFEEGSHGWGNNELQNYTSLEEGNATVSDGILSITARLKGEGQNVGDYTSSRMNSKAEFTFGRMEIRAKMPEHKGNGIWPALWMLGSNISEIGWPNSGEIDMMEYVSYQPDSVLVTIHSVANNHTNGTQISSGFIPLPTIEEEFHNYGLLWSENKLEFYIDEMDNILLTVNRQVEYNQDNWPFDKPFYFIMNIAVGGNLGGFKGVDDRIFPATMEVDYVRVWQFDN